MIKMKTLKLTIIMKNIVIEHKNKFSKIGMRVYLTDILVY